MIYMKNMKKDLSIKQIYDDFILKVTLDGDEIKVLDMYIKNYSYVQMSLALNISERNISRIVNRLKEKYAIYKNLEVSRLNMLLS
nr:MAG TPA: Transcriptional regulatory protein RcsB factor, DNA BINDING PROTEIN.6A [Bacteriophage sp.]